MHTILRRLAASAVLLLLACAAHGQAAYTGAQETFTVSTSGAACVYGNNSSNSGCFQHNNSVNELNYTVAYDLIGSPSITSIILQGCMSVGNICDTLNTYTTSANTLIHGGGYTYDYWVMTPTWSSCGTPPCSVKFEWRGSSNSSPGGGNATQASQVQGTAASGSASSGNPIEVAGVNAGNAITIATDGSGNVGVNVQTLPIVSVIAGASNLGAATVTASSQSSLTTAVAVKASFGNLYGFSVTNGAASVCYLQFINAASGPTLGTASTYSFAVPASGSLTVIGNIGLSHYSTGISVGMSTAYNGSAACGTAATAVIFYD